MDGPSKAEKGKPGTCQASQEHYMAFLKVPYLPREMAYDVL